MDHASNYIHVGFQTSNASFHATLEESKMSFESMCHDVGVISLTYMTDYGSAFFTSYAFAAQLLHLPIACSSMLLFIGLKLLILLLFGPWQWLMQYSCGTMSLILIRVCLQMMSLLRVTFLSRNCMIFMSLIFQPKCT